MRTGAAACVLAALLAGCHWADPDKGRASDARGFPRVERPVSGAAGNDPASEAQRDTANEAGSIMDFAEVRPGMTVADIGAGEGYFTVRLAPRVGKKGRVLAEDIDRAALARLGDRVQRERLDTISISLGSDADPHLPPASFDRIFLIDMYHEVREPYAFLWHLRAALRPGGKVILVDRDRPSDHHGLPPALLFCEFGALHYRLSEFVRTGADSSYYGQFEAVGERPEPAAIQACREQGGPASQFGSGHQVKDRAG